MGCGQSKDPVVDMGEGAEMDNRMNGKQGRTEGRTGQLSHTDFDFKHTNSVHLRNITIRP